MFKYKNNKLKLLNNFINKIELTNLYFDKNLNKLQGLIKTNKYPIKNNIIFCKYQSSKNENIFNSNIIYSFKIKNNIKVFKTKALPLRAHPLDLKLKKLPKYKNIKNSNEFFRDTLTLIKREKQLKNLFFFKAKKKYKIFFFLFSIQNSFFYNNFFLLINKKNNYKIPIQYFQINLFLIRKKISFLIIKNLYLNRFLSINGFNNKLKNSVIYFNFCPKIFISYFYESQKFKYIINRLISYFNIFNINKLFKFTNNISNIVLVSLIYFLIIYKQLKSNLLLIKKIEINNNFNLLKKFQNIKKQLKKNVIIKIKGSFLETIIYFFIWNILINKINIKFKKKFLRKYQQNINYLNTIFKVLNKSKTLKLLNLKKALISNYNFKLIFFYIFIFLSDFSFKSNVFIINPINFLLINKLHRKNKRFLLKKKNQIFLVNYNYIYSFFLINIIIFSGLSFQSNFESSNKKFKLFEAFNFKYLLTNFVKKNSNISFTILLIYINMHYRFYYFFFFFYQCNIILNFVIYYLRFILNLNDVIQAKRLFFITNNYLFNFNFYTLTYINLQKDFNFKIWNEKILYFNRKQFFFKNYLNQIHLNIKKKIYLLKKGKLNEIDIKIFQQLYEKQNNLNTKKLLSFFYLYKINKCFENTKKITKINIFIKYYKYIFLLQSYSNTIPSQKFLNETIIIYNLLNRLLLFNLKNRNNNLLIYNTKNKSSKQLIFNFYKIFWYWTKKNHNNNSLHWIFKKYWLQIDFLFCRDYPLKLSINFSKRILKTKQRQMLIPFKKILKLTPNYIFLTFFVLPNNFFFRIKYFILLRQKKKNSRKQQFFKKNNFKKNYPVAILIPKLNKYFNFKPQIITTKIHFLNSINNILIKTNINIFENTIQKYQYLKWIYFYLIYFENKRIIILFPFLKPLQISKKIIKNKQYFVLYTYYVYIINKNSI